jgi:hypothetical protein
MVRAIADILPRLRGRVGRGPAAVRLAQVVTLALSAIASLGISPQAGEKVLANRRLRLRRLRPLRLAQCAVQRGEVVGFLQDGETLAHGVLRA